MPKHILVTNNIIAKKEYDEICEVEYQDTDMAGVLKIVRDYIHKGHKLLSHPLSGSVKPNENPFKSVLVSHKKGELDLDSLRIIENAIMTTDKFPIKFLSLSEEMRKDFLKIDYSLITNAFTDKNYTN